jgi:UV DNA damage endonuclease
MPAAMVLPKAVDFDGDLTPPPQEVKEETEDLVERAVEKVVGRAEKRKRGKPVSYAEEPGEDGEDEEDVQTKPTPKPSRSRRKTAATEDEAFANDPVSVSTPKKGRKNAAAPVEDEDSPKEKKAKKPTPKKSRLAKDEPENDSDGNEIAKKKRKPKVYPKIEYDIPPVERKETTFRGESGVSFVFCRFELADSCRAAGVCVLEYSAQGYQTG